MTLNDLKLTALLREIPKAYRETQDAVRAGKELDVVRELEKMTYWIDEARRRAKEIANERAFSPSRGGVSG